MQKTIKPQTLLEYCHQELGHQIDRLNQIWIEDADVIINKKNQLNITILTNDFDSDRYNDSALLIRDSGEILQCCWGTNEPGIYYTQNPINAEGTARIAIGYHRAWELGYHRNYPALTQCRNLQIYRDANENGIRDERLTIATAESGINIHHGNNSATIGKYSAGCLVRQSVKKHEEFIAMIKHYETVDRLYGLSIVDPIKLFECLT